MWYICLFVWRKEDCELFTVALHQQYVEWSHMLAFHSTALRCSSIYAWSTCPKWLVIIVHEIQVLYCPAAYYNNFMTDSFRSSGICMFLCCLFVIWYSYSVQAVENAKQVRDETVGVKYCSTSLQVGKVIKHVASIRCV